MADNLDIRGAKKRAKENKGYAKINSVVREEVKHTEPPKGEKYGVCAVCGEVFEQVYREKSNSYMHYNLCPRCRRTKDKGKDQQEKDVKVFDLGMEFFPWQEEADKLLEEHQVLILACGARTGKDRFSNMELVKYLAEIRNEQRHIKQPDKIPPYRFWSIAPTYDMVDQNFRELKALIPDYFIKQVKESDRTIEIKDGGIVECKSAYDVESLVGVALDFCTITEADRIRDLQGVWKNISMRLLSPGCGREKDRNGKKAGAGKCIINSSPTGKKYLYKMYKWGIADPTNTEWNPHFASMNLPSTANPILKEHFEQIVHTPFGDITELELQKRQMSPEDYERDILGHFVDSNGTVFNDFDKCVKSAALVELNMTVEERNEYVQKFKTPIKGHIYRMGYDPATGSSSDSPAIVVRDMITNNIVWIESLWGKNYDEQWDRIAVISRSYNFAPCCWLRTGHTAIENQLAKRGVQEIPLNEQGGKKAEYVQSLERAVQNVDIHILDDGSRDTLALIRQMNDYSETNGKYSNDLEAHDDFVSALYAVYYDYSVKAQETLGFCPTFLGF